MPFFRRRTPSVGLDVGSAFVRAVALSTTGGQWSLVAAGHAPIDRRAADVRRIVARLLDELNLGRAVVSVAVPAESAIVRRFRMPDDHRADLDRRIASEAEEHLPFGTDEVTLSYQVLEPAETEDVYRDRGGLDVLLGAARKTDVAARAALVGGRGRVAGVADVEGLALANAYALNYPDHRDVVLLTHVGARSTVIAILDRGAIVTTRAIDVGVTPDSDAAGIAATMRARAGLGTDRHTSAAFDRIALSGGGAHVSGLSSHLATEFGKPVDLFNPLRRIQSESGRRGNPQVGPEFALAVGLALRRKGDR